MRQIFKLLACASIIFNFQFSILNSQELPQGCFRSPLDGDIALSATFAEFRANHFHGGLDMRTGGVTGKAVRAAADGYVAKVSISSWGGGKMLYIKHPKLGYTTVYMHLDAYAGEIGRAVLREQYAQQSYSITKLFAPDELPVGQGQLVALSGNTGGSGGPHLHFEVRSGGEDDLHTHATAYNPLLFGLPYTDGIKPVIRGLRIYPVGGTPFELGKDGTVSLDRPFYLGIYATDAAEGSTLRNGVHRIEVHVDGTLFFLYTTDAVPVDSTRMVNALIDYRLYADTRQAYLLTRALPGAEGPWIPVRQGDGVFRFEPGSRHRIQVRVYDVKDNLAEQTFTAIVNSEFGIRNSELTGKHDASANSEFRIPNSELSYDAPFLIQQPTVRVIMQPYTLYADDILEVHDDQATPYSAPLVTVRPSFNDIPPNRSYVLCLKPKTPLGVDPTKVVVAQVGAKKLSAYATVRNGEWYSAEVRDFGRFTLAVDTVSPVVLPLGFSEAKALNGNVIKIKIGDNLSGIQTYSCHLNGSWILAEYDGKTAMLVIDARGKLRKGQNELRVEVADGCGNLTRRSFILIH